MGELLKSNGGAVAETQQRSAAVQIMAVCRAVTPQFYKGLTQADLKAEKAAIELITAHIEPEVMSKMCELAVKNYGTARSDNNKVYFDVNYVLKFYRPAFNSVWCDNAALPKAATRAGGSYDPVSRIITESWIDENGEEYIVKYIADEHYNGKQRHYTPRYWAWERERSEAWLNDPAFEL